MKRLTPAWRAGGSRLRNSVAINGINHRIAVGIAGACCEDNHVASPEIVSQFVHVHLREIAELAGDSDGAERLSLYASPVEPIDLVATTLEKAGKPDAGCASDSNYEDLHVAPDLGFRCRVRTFASLTRRHALGQRFLGSNHIMQRR